MNNNMNNNNNNNNDIASNSALKTLWLLFAQAVTVGVAILFVLTTLKPQWLSNLVGGAGGTLTHTAPHAALSDLPALDTPRPNVNTAPIASFADAAARSSKAVVNVFTKQKRRGFEPNSPFNDPFFNFFFRNSPHNHNQSQPQSNPLPSDEGNSLGSGVIVSTDVQGNSFVITNNHVIDQSDSIELVLYDGRRVPAILVGTDPETDIAVLKMQLEQAPVIEWGNLSDVRVGDAVLAVGNPFGVGQTVTQGIVSALGRNHLGINTFENFIQTDAAINPGNSGGALTDSQGRLIGINTAIYSKDGGSLGIGFAIPVTTVKQIMAQLLAGGAVVRGYIGVTPADISARGREKFKLADSVTSGCLLLTVQAGSPADNAGLLAGDVVQAINGATITDSAGLLNAVANLAPKTTVAVQVLRAGKPLTVNITIAKRPKAVQRAQEE
jgi:serine protease DegQ